MWRVRTRTWAGGAASEVDLALRRRRPIVLLLVIVVAQGLSSVPSYAQGAVEAPAQASRSASAEGDSAATDLEAPAEATDRYPGVPRTAARSTRISAAVSDPASLVNDPTTDGLNDTQAGTTLTLAGSNVVAAFADSGSRALGNHQTGYAVSTDGGASFTDRGMLPESALGDGSNAVLATDTTTGRVYMATMTYTGRAQLQLWRSDDGGVTFGPPVNPTPTFFNPASDLLDRLWLYVDNFPGGAPAGQGNVYLVWKHFGGPNFQATYLTRSTDGGATWSTSEISMVEGCNFGQGPFVTVAPDHSVLVTCLYRPWTYGLGGIIVFQRSTDWGRTFGPQSTVTTLRNVGPNGDLQLWGGFRTNSYPQMAVNPVNSDIYLVYNDWSEVSTDWADVYLRVSNDDGATWSPPRRVDSDRGISDQYMPSVAVTADGAKVLVAFYDRRVDDWTIRRMAVIGDVSGQGDLTFGRDFALGPAYPPVVAQDPLVGTTFMGSSDHAIADDRFFYTTWTDNRDPHLSHANQPDVRFAKIPKDLYARSADLSLSLTVSPEPIPVVGGAQAELVVTNAGPDPAPYVELTANLPADFAFTSVETSRGTCLATVEMEVSCAMGTIAPGDTATVRIGFDAGVTPGSATVTARVDTAATDPSTANNTAHKPVTVIARPGMVTDSYSSGPISGAVETGTREFTIDVPQSAGILDVDVKLHTRQPSGHELRVTLIAPDGTEVRMVDPPGGVDQSSDRQDCSGAYTELDDQATVPLLRARSPIRGAFRPMEPLAELRGGPSMGTWRLRVTELYAMATSTLYCWSLDILKDTVNVPPPPPPPTTTTSTSSTTTSTSTTSTTTTLPPAKVAPQSPYSVWAQPASTPLDGIGTWIVPLNEPAARTGQLAASYMYGHGFSFAGSSATGVFALTTAPTGKVALLSVTGPDGRPHAAAVPFDWKAGRFYFLFLTQVSPGVWAAFVYDHTATSWTSIGQLSLPATWGKLSPTTSTIVGWAGATATSCAAYPRADVLVHPTVGYNAGTVATLAGAGNGPGSCPAQTSSFGGGWVRYEVGAA